MGVRTPRAATAVAAAVAAAAAVVVVGVVVVGVVAAEAASLAGRMVTRLVVGVGVRSTWTEKAATTRAIYLYLCPTQVSACLLRGERGRTAACSVGAARNGTRAATDGVGAIRARRAVAGWRGRW
jgi:hypothetical protein